VGKLLGYRRDEVPREWGKLHNGELNDLKSSLNIVRLIKSGRMKWTWYVARMGKGLGGGIWVKEAIWKT
jgi:hypothetical protein